MRAYAWSSYRQYLSAPKERANWMRVDWLFGELGIPKDSMAGRREFEKIMEARRMLNSPEGLKALRRGCCLGSEEFRRKLLEQMEGEMGRYHGGVERQETAEQRASRLLAEELKRWGWSLTDLKRRKKGDPAFLSFGLVLSVVGAKMAK